MSTRRQPLATPTAIRPAPPSQARWLLFVFQLPASPSNLRVRTWRRLQQIGAVPVKQAVYALPDSPGCREDFEWLKTEVSDAGGDATVFTASSVDAWSDDAITEAFRRARQEDYLALAGEIELSTRRLDAPRRPKATPRTMRSSRAVDGFRARLAAIERIDYFGSAGRDRVVTLLTAFDERLRPAPTSGSPVVSGEKDGTSSLRGRLWITRPRPGVDRMGSAWLIRRFIDPEARFGFAAGRDSLPDADAIPFDMFGVEFSHHGGACTFETLCQRFDVREPAVQRLAAIVHDLDLKDGRFTPPEASTVAALIDGLQRATADDHELLEQGRTMFESLYLAFAGRTKLTGPRAVSRATVNARRPPRARKRRR